MSTPIVSMLNSEQLLTCPYDQSHRFRRFKMLNHLRTCRLRYENEHPELAMKACLYNSAHIVPDVEWETQALHPIIKSLFSRCNFPSVYLHPTVVKLKSAGRFKLLPIFNQNWGVWKYHMEECEDRIKGDLMRYQVERNPAFENNTVIPLSDIPDVECDEDWNLPQNPVSINAIIQEKIKEEKVLIPLIGAPKAERKKYYMEERRRHNTLEDAKPSTSNTSVPVDKNQPLRKPKTISELSAGPSCAPPFSQQVPPNLKSKETDEQRIDVNALEETSALVKGTVKPSRMFPKGRGRAPCNNVAASSQPEPKVGSSVPSSCRAAEPIPSVCDVSQNMTNLSIDPISFGSIGGDGSISNPIPNKGRGRKFLNRSA